MSNKVDCSSEYIGQLWMEARAALGPPPAAAPGANPAALATIDPEAQEKQRQATRAAIRGGLVIVSARYLAAWQLTGEELDALADAYADLTLWMFPDTGVAGLFAWWQKIMTKWGPLIVAVQVTGQVVGARVLASMEPDQVPDGSALANTGGSDE